MEQTKSYCWWNKKWANVLESNLEISIAVEGKHNQNANVSALCNTVVGKY
jgi:hypothetical protein